MLPTEDRNLRKVSGPGKSWTGSENPAPPPGSGNKCFIDCAEKHKGFHMGTVKRRTTSNNLVDSIIPTAVRRQCNL